MKTLVQKIRTLIRGSRARKSGQTLVEYSLILCVLTVVAVAVFALLEHNVKILFSAIIQMLDTAQASGS